MTVEIPLILPAVAVLAVVAVEWRTARWAAYAALAAAFVLLTAAFRWPAAGIDQVIEIASGAFLPVLLVARCVAAACVLFAVMRRLVGLGAFR